MASTNPDLTALWDLPSPKPSDPPDVPGDIKALADKLDGIIPLIQYGSVSVSTDGVSAAQDTITYPERFAAPPIVVVTSTNSYWIANVGLARTATTAPFAVRHTAGEKGTGSITMFWVAVGKRA